MKLDTFERNVTANGILSGADFGISQVDQVHILSILRDKLYSDKIGAFVREYSTNAYDAHVEAGIPERPIKLTIPGRFDPTFVVRDFGAGLTTEEVYQVFCQYGRSTKRDSNNVIGQLGLGCKSAFAYTDSFTIISYCNNIKSTYVAYIDETGVGKINKLEQVPTNETGLEIRIAVKATDIPTVQDRANKLFPYFNPLPDININLNKVEYAVVTQSSNPEEFWGVRTTAGNPIAIMGNIPYPIDPSQISSLDENGKELLQCNLDIRFSIGDLSISASREALEYTERTKQAIIKRLAIVRKQMLSSLKAEFENAPNVWEARKIYMRTQAIKYDPHTFNYGVRNRNIIATLASNSFRHWQGFDLANNSIDFTTKIPPYLDVKFLEVSSKKAIGGEVSRWRKTLNITEDYAILKNDVKASWLKRTLHWRDSGNRKNLLVINYDGEFTDPEFDRKIDTYINAHGLTGIPIYKTSSFPLPEEQPRTAGEAPARPQNIKAKSKVFTAKNYSSLAFPASKNWEPAEVDLSEGEGVYVVIYGYQPVDGTSTNRRKEHILDTLFLLGLDSTSNPIYGIRISEKEKLGSGWKELEEWGPIKISELLKNSPELDSLTAVYISTNFQLGVKEELLQEFLLHCTDPRFSVAINAIQSAIKDASALDWKKKSVLHATLKSLESDILQLVVGSIATINEIKRDYPLLETLKIFNNGLRHLDSSWPSTLNEYIELKKR